MTQRSRGRRSFRRGSKPVMLWFNNGVDTQTLAGSTSITAPLLTAGVLPTSYLHGMTILRLILAITYAAVAGTDFVNALTAFYVGTRGSAPTPPDLNADLANYYYYAGLQNPRSQTANVNPQKLVADIRTKRSIRGEDTDLFWRVTNNELTAMDVGMEVRMLLQMK